MAGHYRPAGGADGDPQFGYSVRSANRAGCSFARRLPVEAGATALRNQCYVRHRWREMGHEHRRDLRAHEPRRTNQRDVGNRKRASDQFGLLQRRSQQPPGGKRFKPGAAGG